MRRLVDIGPHTPRVYRVA